MGRGFTRWLLRSVVACAALCTIGCGGSIRPVGPESATFGTCAPTPCVKVFLSGIPTLDESLPVAAREAIQKEVAASLYAPLDVESSQPSAASLLREVRERYEEYRSVSDATIDWTFTREARRVYGTSHVVSMEISSEGYLGGAHGFKEQTLMTFDAQTGARFAVSDVVEDAARPTLAKIVEAEFRRARRIPQSQTLQDAGFFILPGQEMPLSENFAITAAGLHLHYNPYEVGPYVMGETDLTVPREAVEPILKPRLRGVFDAPEATLGAS